MPEPDSTPKPVPKPPVSGRPSTTPIAENGWGTPDNKDINYHEDGAVGTAIGRMGHDARMDVDGEPVANVLGRVATDVVTGRRTAQDGLNKYKAVRDRLPEGSTARAELDHAIGKMDAPDTPAPQVPDGTPQPLRQLITDLHAVPIVRNDPGREMNDLVTLAGAAAAGRIQGPRLAKAVREVANRRHESEGDAGKFEIDRAVQRTVNELRKPPSPEPQPPTPQGDVTPTTPTQVLTGTPDSAGEVSTGDRAVSSEPTAGTPYARRAQVWAETARNATTEQERRGAQARADEWARIAEQADEQARRPQPDLGFAIRNTNVATGNARVGSQHAVSRGGHRDHDGGTGSRRSDITVAAGDLVGRRTVVNGVDVTPNAPRRATRADQAAAQHAVDKAMNDVTEAISRVRRDTGRSVSTVVNDAGSVFIASGRVYPQDKHVSRDAPDNDRRAGHSGQSTRNVASGDERVQQQTGVNFGHTYLNDRRASTDAGDPA